MALIRTSWSFLLVKLYIFGAASKDCNVSVETEGSTITSPNFPSDYTNNARCWYSIHAPRGYVVTLVFSMFEVEKGSGSACRYDKLYVYDSSTYFENPVYILCGYTLPASVTSTNNSLTLLFETDDTLAESGFQGQVSFTRRKDASQKYKIDTFAGTTYADEMSSLVIKTNIPATYDLGVGTVFYETSPLIETDIPGTSH
ncbi:Tolloid-like protein 1 [Holothuria leucospilota]|uniref:Tolloid-like protein 1 n=1 Tax=Holothuria leucospilota TaxID=206669 RepID=A0A9Q1BEF3_HOLLE|nr:Tolloid-like protein 1 [Holothuria leucospilota]